MVKGKHAASGPSTFIRDLALMVSGILVVGLVVFGGLWLFSGGDDATPLADETTTTTAAPTTSTSVATTTTEPATTSTTTTTTTLPTVRDPSEVRVLVLNGVGISGIAARVTASLAEAGYQMLQPDNYPSNLEQTRVWYRSGYAAEAFELAAYFPDALVEQNDEAEGADANLIVVLGASYEE